MAPSSRFEKEAALSNKRQRLTASFRARFHHGPRFGETPNQFAFSPHLQLLTQTGAQKPSSRRPSDEADNLRDAVQGTGRPRRIAQRAQGHDEFSELRDHHRN